MQSWLRVLLTFVAAFWSLPISAQQPWFFAIMSDPQFGMYANDKNFTQETANFEFAIANINRLHPKFVVVAGDLVNDRNNADQIAEYKRLIKKIDPQIPVYSVPGNHDVGNVPSPDSIRAYRDNRGPDYYTFKAEDILGVVLDSNLIRSPERDPQDAAAQEKWLLETLQKAKEDPQRKIVVFQHIPYFLKTADEKDDYFNIPQPMRGKYLQILRAAGVNYVYAGHYHRNSIATDGSLTITTSGAVGMPIGGSLSGFRVVEERDNAFQSAWYCLAGIPNRVDLDKLANTPCPQ